MNLVYLERRKMVNFFTIHNKATKRDGIFAGAIIVVHVCFFILACLYKRIYMGDSFEYVYEALNMQRIGILYSGNPAMPIIPDYLTQRTPLYPLFLYVSYFFSLSNWGVIIIQNFISINNILLVRRLLGNLGYNKKYDMLLFLFICTYPAQFINANTIAPDILLQAFTILYALYYCKFIQTKRVSYVGFMSIILIAGFMTKPVLYPFAFIHILLVAGSVLWLKLNLRIPLIVAFAPLLGVVLYCSLNSIRTGKFHFSSNSAFNAEYYFYKYYTETEGIDSAEKFIHIERSKIAALGSYSNQYDYAAHKGFSLLIAHYYAYTVFHLKHSLWIYLDPGKAEMDLFTGKLTYGKLYSKQNGGFANLIKTKGISAVSSYFRENPSMIVAILVFIFNIIRLMGFCFMLRDKRISVIVRVFILLFTFYFAVAAGPIENTRYFLPVSLLVAGCSVLGWGRVWEGR